MTASSQPAVTMQKLMAVLLQKQLAARTYQIELPECEAIIASILTHTAELAAIAVEALNHIPRLVVDNGDKPA